MTNREDFAAVQAKMVAVSLLLYPILCLPSFLGMLKNAGILSWDQYLDILGSSFVANVYLGEFYRLLGNGWLLMLIIVPVIVAFSVASWKDRGRTQSGDQMTLGLKLIAMNTLLMAVLAPLTLLGILSNIEILPDDTMFEILNSEFIEAIYGHEYSWIYAVLPFLIISPIILSACARSWYEPEGPIRVAPASGVSDPSRY